MDRLEIEDQINETMMRAKRMFGSLVLSMIGSPNDIDDVLQDAHFAAYRFADQFDPKKAKMLTWLKTIVINKAKDFSRRKKTRDKFIRLNSDVAMHRMNRLSRRETEAEVIDSLSAKHFDRRDHDEAIDRLDEQEFTEWDINWSMRACNQSDALLLELAYVHEVPIKYLSWRFDIPIGTVKSRLFRAKEVFRRQYAEISKVA